MSEAPEHLSLHHTRKDADGNSAMAANTDEPLEHAAPKEPVAEHKEE